MLLVSILLPVLVIALAGFMSARRRFFGESESHALSRLTFSILIPCLLFISTPITAALLLGLIFNLLSIPVYEPL